MDRDGKTGPEKRATKRSSTPGSADVGDGHPEVWLARDIERDTCVRRRVEIVLRSDETLLKQEDLLEQLGWERED